MMSFTSLKRLVLGDPISTQREKDERLSIPLALAVFASDALSSTAYATEEILLAFSGTIVAGLSGFTNLLSVPIALAIGLLMGIVVVSYRQVIKAYPEGGGTYEVSKDYIGLWAGQTAGAALLIDYVLTVAVSISAGMAAIASTGLMDWSLRVPMAITFIFIIMLLNLRGLRESGKVFAVPAYVFIGLMVTLLGTGLYKLVTGQATVQLHAIATTSGIPDNVDSLMGIALFLALLKAFSHGCVALTGIEAISDGVKAFKEPAPINANKTLVLMGVVLGSIFVGMTVLAYAYHVLPTHNETVVSQIARSVFGDGSILYYALQLITTLILILAANTSFSGFPRLANILASDGFLPRQFMNLGDRLVFSNGIIVLGIFSALLVWVYGADTHSLIPLYAVGVFLSFTLAQLGMVKYHLSQKQPGWRYGLVMNAFGGLTTAIVTVILGVEKFWDGAWLVLVALPLFVWVFHTIHSHYQVIRKQMALPDQGGYCPISREHTALVLVSSLNQGTIPALEYAKTIAKEVEAVHIELKPQATQRLLQAWDDWGCGVPLTVLKSPYRSITEPIVRYVDEVESHDPNRLVTIIVPEFVTSKFWHNILHNQTSIMIKTLLRMRRPGKIVTTVRYYLDE